jgi:hypothetical protein
MEFVIRFPLALILLAAIALIPVAAILVVIWMIREIWNRTPLVADLHKSVKLGNLIMKLEILLRIWKLFCSVLKYTVVADFVS